MNVRTPTKEQKEAIEHEGGVLLSAGAGSGKTFVLVEHLFYLAEQHLNKIANLSSEEQKVSLEKFFSSIVLTTFTRKACAEIRLRLENRFEGIMLEALPFLNVTTIDGFCYKLLSAGYFSSISGHFEIIEDWEMFYKIRSLLKKWALDNDKELNRKFPKTFSKFIADLDKYAKILLEIFKSPMLHLEWLDRAKEGKIDELPLEVFLKKYLEICGLEDVLENVIELPIFEKKTPSWALLLQSFLTLKETTPLVDLTSLKKYLDFFKENKKRTTGSDEGPSVEYYNRIFGSADSPGFREIIKEYSEDLICYEKSKEGLVAEWVKFYYEMFLALEDHYYSTKERSFSDLAYLVCCGLKDDQALNKIRSEYNYIIIDEFQDTSPVQFYIARKILNDNFFKLFVVGDLKQAIYAFRGGDVDVFKLAIELMPRKLSLSANYRSSAKIIEFNNKLFESLFIKGKKYKGGDRFGITMDAQNVANHEKIPIQLKEESVFKYYAKIEKAKELTNSTLYQNEAKIVAKIIKSYIENGKKNICVLYQNLSPSKFLIHELMANDIGFNAQFKMLFQEDPFLAVFNTLVEITTERFSKTEMSYSLTHVALITEIIFKALDVPWDLERINKSTEIFLTEIGVLGLYEAFYKWCFSNYLRTSNNISNLNKIKKICHTFHDSPEMIYSFFSEGEQKYSVTFHWGNQSADVSIMTTHSSKGLEFEHVFLAGISGGRRYGGEKSDLGKQPSALKWKETATQTNYKTPQFILEEIENKLRDFSESKRLFYVACTRAQKTLNWVEFQDGDGLALIKGKDSWANGLNIFLNENIENQKLIKACAEELNDKSSNQAGQDLLYYKDPLGVTKASVDLKLGHISELSVTQLALLEECSRKFYIQVICKITPEDLNLDHFVEQEKQDRPISSKKRGLMIHKTLELWAKNGRADQQVEDNLEWVCDLISKNQESHEIIVEKLMKFSLFGQMISAIPDIMLIPKGPDAIFKIWDYKTGKREGHKEKAYFFQLYCYAYAAYETKIVGKDQPIQLALLYVDENYQHTLNCDYNSLKDRLYLTWMKLNSLGGFSPEHCSFCEFGNICQVGNLNCSI